MRWGKRRKNFLFPILIVIFIQILHVLPISIQGVEISERSNSTRSTGIYLDPEINVTLDREVFIMNVEDADEGEALITGNLHCDLPASTPPGISVSITLTLMIDLKGTPKVMAGMSKEYRDHPFTFSVFPGPYEKAGTRHDFTIDVYWEYSTINGGAGEAKDAFGTIEIGQYGQISISKVLSENYWEISPEVPYRARLQLKNLGNSETSISLTATDIPEGISVEFENDEMIIREFSFSYVWVTILQENNEKMEETINVQVVGSVPGDGSTQNMELDIVSPGANKENESYSISMIVIVFMILFFGIMIFFFILVRRNK